jgi:ammonia channel protein AmtB
VVHTVGGMAALVSTYFIGPRAGRFGVDGQVNTDYRENNGNLVVLGTFLLWCEHILQTVHAFNVSKVQRSADIICTTYCRQYSNHVACLCAHNSVQGAWPWRCM